MSPGWNGRRSQRRYNGEGCPHSFWDKFLHLSTHRRKVKREQAVSLTLSDPQDTGQTGAISKIGREQEGAGGSWLATGGTNEEAKKKEPCQMQKGPQHACFPSLAHESRG